MRKIGAAKVTAVVLAAGRSSRMGQAKQLIEVDGLPMVVRATTTALQCDAAEVAVITGAYATEVAERLTSLRREYANQLSIFHNADWSTGQASSVRVAVAALQERSNAILFLPVDQPFVPVMLLNQLIAAWQAGALLAAPAIAGKIRGAPAIFDGSLFPELLALEGDTGARPLLQRHRVDLVTIPAEAAWLRDIDTLDDLAAVVGSGKRSS